MKKRKNLIMELIILITIIGSVIVVYYAYNELKNTSPTESDSKYIKNYSKEKYLKIIKDFDDTSTYELPEKDKIIQEESDYKYYVTANDNYITTIDEIIEIQYDNSIETKEVEETEVPEETDETDETEETNETKEPEKPLDQDKIINYCNSYNDINSNYKLTCSYSNYKLILKNTFYLKNIYGEEIKTKKYTIKKDINYDDSLDELMKELTKKEIKYAEVEKIE